MVMSFKVELEKGANGGGPVGGLSEPKLASLSANSLSVIPVCAGTQMLEMVVYCERRRSLDCVNSTVLELMVVAVRERMADLLSVQMCVVGVFSAS